MPSGKYTRPIRPIEFVIGPSIAYIPLTQGQFALVDWDDALWMQAYSWHAIWAENIQGFYAGRTGSKMHRDILVCPKDVKVDHANLNTLDNRRCNLRIATNFQNGQNSRMSSRNKSGYRGVHWNKQRKCWIAYISVNGVNVYLGGFPTKELAHTAYCAAALEYHGEFARTK